MLDANKLARMRFWAYLAVLSMLLGLVRGNTSWKLCGRGEFDVNRLVLNPDPLVSGKNFDISLPGTAQANCTGGEVQILVYLHGLHIYTTTKDLCGFTECPVKQGDVVIRYESSLPRLTPSGTYHVVMKATDTAGAPLLCLSVDLNIVFSLGYDKFAQELKPIEFQRVLAEM